MTRVDFYILQDVDLAAMHRFACRIVCKAIGDQLAPDNGSLYLHTSNSTQAQEVDEILWNYPRNRFVPHDIQKQGPEELITPTAPVWIGWQDPPNADGLLINLADQIPEFFGRFDRVTEIIVSERKDIGRERYKFYRDRGYPLFHHELNDWEQQ